MKASEGKDLHAAEIKAARKAKLAEGPQKKKCTPGSVALRETSQLQYSTESRLRKKTFARLVKEIAADIPAHTMGGILHMLKVKCFSWRVKIT